MLSDDEEVWKSIPGYSGWHEVSNLGRVRSTTRSVSDGRVVRGHMKRLSASRSGHLRVNLSSPGERGVRFVHRLVMQAFVGACPEGMEVRHLNDDPTDNRLSNLAYGTRSDNKNDRVRNGIDHETRKTHCPRGHLHAPWNCVASEARNGHRSCMACARARADAHQRRSDFDPVKADEIYARLRAAA